MKNFETIYTEINILNQKGPAPIVGRYVKLIKEIGELAQVLNKLYEQENYQRNPRRS